NAKMKTNQTRSLVGKCFVSLSPPLHHLPLLLSQLPSPDTCRTTSRTTSRRAPNQTRILFLRSIHRAPAQRDPESKAPKSMDDPRLGRKIRVFADFFAVLEQRGLLFNESKALCIGARVGQEVEALRRVGVSDSVGIDLVPYPPLVLQGDFSPMSSTTRSTPISSSRRLKGR
ncbi:unnamed protein product, partial [Thlaspi arvense]